MNWYHKVWLGILTTCYCGLQSICAQQSLLHGIVLNGDGQPVSAATIRLIQLPDSQTIAYAVSGYAGRYRIEYTSLAPGSYVLKAEHLQFGVAVHRIGMNERDTIKLILEARKHMLQEVRVVAKPPAVRIRGDTVEFRAAAFQTAEVRKLEDLLKQMQGFSVGSDGRITFNGKTVDRILVEGDDLSGKNYTLLSRNLNSGLVEKVQVIPNFSEDRLTSRVESTGKVAINLTLAGKTKQKPSGSLEAGLASDGRYVFDANLVYLKGRIRSLALAQSNRTGLAGDADFDYYFESEEPGSSSFGHQQSLSDLVETGTIINPPLENSYVRNNREHALALMGAYRPVNSVKIRAMLSWVHKELSQEAFALQKIVLPSGESWAVMNREYWKPALSGLSGTLSLHHDRGKRNNGYVQLDLGGRSANDRFDNITSLAIVDTLQEKLQLRKRTVNIRGFESFALDPRTIVRFSFHAFAEQFEHQLESVTNRYAGYFGLPATFEAFLQDLPGRQTGAELDLRLVGRKGMLRYTGGVRYGRQKASMDHDLYSGSSTGQDTALAHGLSRSDASQTLLYLALTLHTGKMQSVRLVAEMGPGRLSAGTGQDKPSEEGIAWRVAAAFERKLSATRRLSLVVRHTREMPALYFFHPPALIAGNASVLFPATELRFLSQGECVLQYGSQNFRRQSGLQVMGSLRFADKQYNWATVQDPNVIALKRGINSGLHAATTSISGEKYAHRIRQKFTGQLSLHGIRTYQLINAVNVRNTAINLSAHFRVLSAFKSPVNIELGFSPAYLVNQSVPETGETTRADIWQYTSFSKIKLSLGSRWFGSFQLRYFRLSPASAFRQADAFCSWKVTPVWTLSVHGHNLLNEGVISQRFNTVNQRNETGFVVVRRYVLLRVSWQF